MLNSRDYFRQIGTSAVDTAQNLDQTIDNDAYVRYVYIAASDGSRVGWQLQRPAGTTILTGYSPDFVDFGPEGFFVPGAVGEDVRLAVAASTGGTTTRAMLIGIDKPRSH